MRDTATNVRDSPSSFVGRGADFAALAERFERGARLVTLTGAGGMGKTRLAVRYAQAQIESYSAHGGAGVWFADLTEARSVTDIVAAVAGALGLRIPAGASDATAAEALAPAIDRLGRLLLVLDNFEHLVAVGSRAVETWLKGASRARFLVTSRAALGLSGEVLWPLDSLPERDAVDLFLGRARQVRPGLRPSEEERAVVSEIVRSLEGMPLAIELAASRMAVLSPAQLRARLDRPLDLLADHTGAGRHGSVKRTVLDSVRLLGAPERSVLAACAVFRDGFSMEAAEAVVGRAGVLGAVEALVRYSLLRASPTAEPRSEVRFSFFETIREVAAELLANDPEREAIEERHAGYYAAFARQLGAAAAIHSGGPEFVRLAQDLENAVAAHAHAVAHARREPEGPGAQRAAVIALGLDPVLSVRGLSRLRLRLLDEAVAELRRSPSSGPAELAEALLARGLARRELGEMEEARGVFEEGLALATHAGSPALAALAHVRIGEIIEVAGGTSEAHARFEQALDLLARTNRDAMRSLREAEVHMRIAHAHRREGGLGRAESAAAEAIALYRRLEHDEGMAAALYEAAVVAMFQGRRKAALARFDEGLAVARRADVRAVAGALTTARGGLLQEMGELDEALAHHADAARVFHELGSRYRETSALYYLATAYLERGDVQEAERFLARASERVRGVGSPRYEALIEGCRAVALARMGDRSASADAMLRAEQAVSRCPTEPALGATMAIHRLTVAACAARAAGAPNGTLARAKALARAHPSDDSRFAVRILSSVLRPARARRAIALTVWDGGKAFRPPRGRARVDLSRRAPLSRILGLLVQRRLDAPGDSVAIEDIVRAGWPDEWIQTQAALNRAYVALTTLRKMGLRDVLVTGAGGYWLSPAVAVALQPSAGGARWSE